MIEKLEIFKKKLLYRATYRGTKELDILLTNFVKKYINQLNDKELNDLQNFLELDDEEIINYYHNDIINDKIKKNSISKIFKDFKL